MTERNHPDAGTTTWEYDMAGNLLKTQTANLYSASQYIEYDYEYNRLEQVTYPENPENNVYYEYGGPSSGNQTGRVTKIQDASGVQSFEYGKLGEMTKNIHTFVTPTRGGHTYSFEMDWEYDSWNRLKSITYPDGEKVTYAYNNSGLLTAIDGLKGTDTYAYVDTISYDKYERRSGIVYGNGAYAQYEYDSLMHRMERLRSWDSQDSLMQDLSYSYDDVGNIDSIANNAGGSQYPAFGNFCNKTSCMAA